MNKKQRVQDFCDMLDSFNISYVKHGDYHVQVQIIHNFYPTTNRYYNSDDGRNEKYPNFEDRNDFLTFLGSDTDVENEETETNIFETLQDIYDTIEKVKELRDDAFYGHDGNCLFNVDINKCYFDAKKVEELDSEIDNLYNKLEKIKK